MSDIFIRNFIIEDYGRVFRLWKSTEGMALSEADSEDNIRLFLERNPGLSFIALNGDQVIGAVICGHDGRRGLIHHLAVDEKYRCLGIGKKLTEKCLAGLKAAGIEKCHLFVFTDNVEAQQFWAKIGWELRKDICVMSSLIPE